MNKQATELDWTEPVSFFGFWWIYFDNTNVWIPLHILPAIRKTEFLVIDVMQKKESVNMFFPAAQNIFYVYNQVFLLKTFVNI